MISYKEITSNLKFVAGRAVGLISALKLKI